MTRIDAMAVAKSECDVFLLFSLCVDFMARPNTNGRQTTVLSLLRIKSFHRKYGTTRALVDQSPHTCKPGGALVLSHHILALTSSKRALSLSMSVGCWGQLMPKPSVSLGLGIMWK